MRKPRPGFNFSMEQIFSRVRELLASRVAFTVCTSTAFNDGYWSKLCNILEAARRVNRRSVLHITGETHFLNLLMPRQNVVLTIHDCRYMERKKGLAKKIVGWLYLEAPVRHAAYITVVSEATKADVVRYTGCDPDRVIVIPVNINPVFQPVPKKFNPGCPVILQVGAGENKNIGHLAQALAGLSCRLVIIGEPAGPALGILKANGIDYTLKNNLSAAELYREYINCDLVSFISTFEGFGMPLVEAQWVERPVITSALSSMPEVAGAGACFVNPADVKAIRRGLEKIIHDENYRSELLCQGRKNRERFNETAIAEAYFKIYCKIAAHINE